MASPVTNPSRDAASSAGAPPEAGGPTSGRNRVPLTCPKCGTEVETPRLAHRSDWPWLPTQDKGLLAPHPYCTRCGRVKLVGADRAHDVGGLVNVIARLCRRLEGEGYKVTDAQRRLILKTLQAAEADDKFSLSRESQVQMICDVVSRYLYIPEYVVETYLRAG